MSREFEIVWPDFNITITVELLDDENPNLCEEFWQGLPFETIFAASMSAGEMFKVPIPFIMSSETQGNLVPLPDQLLGSVVSLASMSSLLIKYGNVAEPFRLPIIGRIPEEELGTFRSVALKLRDAYFFTKEVNLATLRRKE